jgi:hypothetical protein
VPSKDDTSKIALSASGSVVEIISIPLHFFASKCDLLGDLFVPLLSSAQEASDLLAVRVGDNKSALRAASYMAGELMHDANFAPTKSMFAKVAHAYAIDLPGNGFKAQTCVSANEQSGIAQFQIDVKGAIRGDKFIAVDPQSNMTLFSFTRSEADKPDFFARDFPFLASEARKDPAVSSGGQSAAVQAVIDLMLGIPVAGKTITVRIQKREDASSLDVKHATTNKTLLTLPLTSLSNMTKLVETIAQHFSANMADAAL